MLLIRYIRHASVSAFQICLRLFMSDPEDPPRRERWGAFHLSASLKVNIDVMFLTDDGRPETSLLLTCVQLFMLAMFHSSPAVIYRDTRWTVIWLWLWAFWYFYSLTGGACLAFNADISCTVIHLERALLMHLLLSITFNGKKQENNPKSVAEWEWTWCCICLWVTAFFCSSISDDANALTDVFNDAGCAIIKTFSCNIAFFVDLFRPSVKTKWKRCRFLNDSAFICC